MFEYSNIGIEKISGAVPKRRVTNDHFSHLLSEKEIRVFEKTTGIKERRYADESTTASDLGLVAAKDILKDIDKSEIKALVYVSQTSDYKIPFTSNILQHKLELAVDTLCIDINAGCAGFVQGLNLAYSLVGSLKKGKVLLVIAETLSKILAPNDRTTTTLFGDGAVALIVGKCSSPSSFFNFYSDGGNFDAIIIPDGGYRNPFTEESLTISKDESGNEFSRVDLQMDGSKVFDFTLREIPNSINSLLKFSQTDISEVDAFVPHQSNRFIIKQIARNISVANDKCLVNIQDFGNTSGVSIPLAILSNSSLFTDTKKVLCSGYGSGLNWGNCLVTLSNKTTFGEIIEV